MDPQAEKTPGITLPKPSMEQAIPGMPSYQPNVVSAEALLPSVEAAPVPAAAPPVTVPNMPAMGTVPQPVAPAAPVAVPVGTPAQATDDDTDALDEEWINKAKAIVEQTKHDPRLESHELSKVKADYLRIRYNKQIKVAEDQAK
jgi:hypothetical protein